MAHRRFEGFYGRHELVAIPLTLLPTIVFYNFKHGIDFAGCCAGVSGGQKISIREYFVSRFGQSPKSWRDFAVVRSQEQMPSRCDLRRDVPSARPLSETDVGNPVLARPLKLCWRVKPRDDNKMLCGRKRPIV